MVTLSHTYRMSNVLIRWICPKPLTKEKHVNCYNFATISLTFCIANTYLYLPITQALCVCCTYAFFRVHVCAVHCECEEWNYCLDRRWWPPAPHRTTARRPTPSPSHRCPAQTQLNRPLPASATRTAQVQARLSPRPSLRAPQPPCLALSASSFYPSPCSLSLSSSALLSISWK